MTPRAEPGRRRGPGHDGRLGRPARVLVAVLVCMAGAAGRQGADAEASTRPHEDLGSSLARAAAPLLESTSPSSPRMIPARDGWVTKSSLQLCRLGNPDPFPARKSAPLDPLAQGLDALVATQLQLARRGIGLLSVPIPSRMNVSPDALAEVELDPDIRGCAPGLDRFHARLRARGVEVRDLPPRLAAARGSLAAGADPTSPGVLWGDSFARIFKSEGADVPRHLHHLLGAPLDVVALDAGGPYASRAPFARRRQALAGKRLVIWTFAARSLLTDQWKPVRLQRD